MEATRGTLPRLAALSAFFTACEERLVSADTSGHYHVFHEAAFLLGSRIADGVVWDWFQEQARGAVAPQRQQELALLCLSCTGSSDHLVGPFPALGFLVRSARTLGALFGVLVVSAPPALSSYLLR